MTCLCKLLREGQFEEGTKTRNSVISDKFLIILDHTRIATHTN